MSFKSEAQREKFRRLVKEGKMSQATFDEWESKTPADIPKRVGPERKKMNSTDDIRATYKKRFGG